jgi:hypothetical protein
MDWYYHRADLKRAVILCAIVGTWLVAFNQGSLLLTGGSFPVILYLKIFLDYATPFTVSSITGIMRNRSEILAKEKQLAKNHQM